MKFKIFFEKFIKNNFLLTEKFEPDEWFERLDNMKYRMVEAFLRNPKGKWSLIQVPAERFKKIWLEFGKYDRISDLNGLDKIAESLLSGIASLEVANQLQGHHENGMGYHELFEEVKGWTEEETDENIDEQDLYEWLTVIDEGDGAFMSDYGLDKLLRLVSRISNEEDPRDRLMAIDQALNVIHQRSDLAKFFISGGTKTLNDIFFQGGYSSDV
jgi:hypothetical protein